MTSLDPWTRPSQRGVRSAAYGDHTHFSPHRHQQRYHGDHQPHHHHHKRADYTTAASATTAGQYVLYSPTTSRRKIAELERRLTELRSSSQSMTQQLGQAERSLRALDLDTAAGRRRTDLVRFSGDDMDDRSSSSSSSSSSDDEDGHVMRRHRRHGSKHIHGGRDALRREIAQIHEDLHVLRRQCSSYDDVSRPAALRRDVIGGDMLMTDWGRNQLVRSSTDDDLFLRDGYRRRHRHNFDRDISPTCCAGDFGFDRRGNSAMMMSGPTACCTDARRSGLHGRTAAAGRMSPTCCGGTGMRSVLYKQPLTQHNRTLLSSPGPTHRNWYDSFDTASKRAFKPCQPSEVAIGDIVKFRRSGGRMELGRVLYVGHLPGKNGAYLGVELENATGNHDGLNGGFRYFQCKPNRGLLVSFDKVIMAWSNY